MLRTITKWAGEIKLIKYIKMTLDVHFIPIQRIYTLRGRIMRPVEELQWSYTNTMAGHLQKMYLFQRQSQVLEAL